MTNHPILDAFGTMWKRIVTALNNKADKTYVETYVEKYVAENAVGGGGAIINSGTELPETGIDGEVFLKTSMVGEEYTETVTISSGTKENSKIVLTYPIASIISTQCDVSDLYFSESNGKLYATGDCYNGATLTITYIVAGADISRIYPKQVYCDITSYDKDISGVLVKGIDTGDKITLYLDYSRNNQGEGEEFFNFGPGYADKTLLGVYFLTHSGLAASDEYCYYNVGAPLSNGFTCAMSTPRLDDEERKQEAVVIIYYV